jgi:tetratricopeptide (TPR) repeat protein
VPDNTLAISFLNAAAAQQQGELDVVTNVEEDAVVRRAKELRQPRAAGVLVHVSVGVGPRSHPGRARRVQPRRGLDPDAPAAHVGLGIMRFNERSANRAKTELLAALRADPNNVLAREYLGQLYQTDLRDPQRGLEYVIDVPNSRPKLCRHPVPHRFAAERSRQPDAAITYLRKGIALDANHVGEAGQHGYTLIARIYISQHKLKEATAVLNDRDRCRRRHDLRQDAAREDQERRLRQRRLGLTPTGATVVPESEEPVDDGRCVGCGPLSEIGLKNDVRAGAGRRGHEPRRRA